jgi:hypothetical protein
MQFFELQKKFSAESPHGDNSTVEGEAVVPESRMSLRPKDCIEDKLRALLATNTNSRTPPANRNGHVQSP